MSSQAQKAEEPDDLTSLHFTRPTLATRSRSDLTSHASPHLAALPRAARTSANLYDRARNLPLNKAISQP